MAKWETLRHRYRPRETRALFIGESPPSGGTFFYAMNSRLHDATRDAFLRAIPSLNGRPFVEVFAEMGCYLDDLCLEPVDQLDLRDSREKQERLAMRRNGEKPLARRIRMLGPRVIVVVVMGIVPNVVRAQTVAGLSGVPRHVLPFPGQWWRKRYITELSALVKSLRRSRLLVVPPGVS